MQRIADGISVFLSSFFMTVLYGVIGGILAGKVGALIGVGVYFFQFFNEMRKIAKKGGFGG